MADEAFALSPISARAAQPNEEDYAAIHEAFMETSRGRWFLGEYAKRNRNADTRMVLDAVARIEGSLAAQKQAAAEADLMEALADIRKAVGESQAAANAGLDGLAFDERLAPIARSVRIIREISWRWRETGADGRICDILDSQVAAIEDSAGHVSLAEARGTIDEAFAAIETRIDQYGGEPAASAPVQPLAGAPDANVVPFPAPAEGVAAAETDTLAAAAPVAQAPAAEAADAHVAAAPAVETAEAMPAAMVEPAAKAHAPIAAVVDDIEFVDEAAADAHDEAVLDLIAAEMSAPQAAEDFEMPVAEVEFADPDIVQPDIIESGIIESGIIEPEIIETTPLLGERGPAAIPVVAPRAAEPVQPAPTAAALPTVEPSFARTQDGEADLSIGSAIIASGILSKPNRPAGDALAPIRRMSQAEKIAFFS